MFQKILGFAELAIGIVYAAAILRKLKKNKEEFKEAPGSIKIIAPAEFCIYLISNIGIPDFPLNTLLLKKLKLGSDALLPGTTVGCAMVPCTVIACILLNRSDCPIHLPMLIICGAAVMLGSIIGSKFASKMDGKVIKNIIRIALIGSLAFLIIKMILSSGMPGAGEELRGIKLAVAAALCFLTGAVNMFGVPMKPTWTALFLILGLSPLTTLSMVLVLSSLAPIAGAFNVIKAGRFQKKMVGCAAVFGTLGAAAGGLLAVSVPAAVLNVLPIIVILFTIISMFRN